MSRSFALLAGSFLGAALAAHAFVAIPDDAGRLPRWDLVTPDTTTFQTNIVNPATKAVRYFIGSEAYSATNRVAELNAVRGCFAQWEAIPGSTLKFEEGGLILGPADIDNEDYTNTVYWARSSTWVNGGTDNISGILGAAVYAFFDDNTLAECDIVLNGAQFRWATSAQAATDANTYFIDSILLHEIGHMVGLDHSPVGGANLMARGESGLGLGIGLTTDEIAAARALYPRSDWLPRQGTIQGAVRLNGAGVYGGVVTAEDAAGNLIAGTVTRQGGVYDLPALPPGAYQVRATPLDPANASALLLSGYDINAQAYAGAQTAFLPSEAQSISVTGGGTTTANLAVTSGNPAFRIARLRVPTTNPARYELINAAVSVRPGDSNVIIGVLSPTLPTANASFTVSGDGITARPPTYYPALTQNYNLISASIDVSPTATPGLRTLTVRRGTDVAYANGFLVVAPTTLDLNFDGVDDAFQRQYFPLFTAPEAGPLPDPDGDGFNNLVESIAGTNPLDPRSVLRFDSIRSSGSASVVLEWLGAANKKYQIFAKPAVLGADWSLTAPLVLGTGPRVQWTDTTAPGARLYRLQAIP